MGQIYGQYCLPRVSGSGNARGGLFEGLNWAQCVGCGMCMSLRNPPLPAQELSQEPPRNPHPAQEPPLLPAQEPPFLDPFLDPSWAPPA